MRSFLLAWLFLAAACAPGSIAESTSRLPGPADGAPSRDAAVDRTDASSPDVGQIDASPAVDAAPDVVDARVLDPCRFRNLGYGQEAAESDQSDATLGSRKSGIMCLLSSTNENIWVRGQGAGNCGGDSGGPLYIEGTRKIVGVLHGSDQDCSADERFSIFVSTAGHRAFIEQTLASE